MTWADRVAVGLWILLPIALWTISVIALCQGRKRRRRR